MEAAKAVKMYWQNMRKQNKVDDVFATVETREKELERCHSIDSKDRQHVFVDRAEAYQPTAVREYFSESVTSLVSRSRNNTSSVRGCASSGTGGGVGVSESDPGSAHLIQKVDHCRLNLISSSLFQL